MNAEPAALKQAYGFVDDAFGTGLLGRCAPSAVGNPSHTSSTGCCNQFEIDAKSQIGCSERLCRGVGADANLSHAPCFQLAG
jgi:hypothetical protein